MPFDYALDHDTAAVLPFALLIALLLQCIWADLKGHSGESFRAPMALQEEEGP